MSRALAALLPLLMLSLGCGDAGELVTLDEWVVSDRDPFLDLPDAERTCDPFSYGREGGHYEIETSACRYLTLEHETLRDVPAGAEITMSVWNLGLYADPPASAHVAVSLGASGWEETLPIPSEAAFMNVSFVAEEETPAGTPFFFHLHNHGANSWRFTSPVASD